MEHITKLSILFGIFNIALSQQQFVADEFTVIERQRKEIRQLSDLEWDMYSEALNRLESSGTWMNLAFKHNEYFTSGIHNSPEFLPWHRQFLYEIEYELNQVYPEANGSISVPYWDWTMDAADVLQSPVFSIDRFGEFPDEDWGCINSNKFGVFQQCVRRSNFFQENMWDSVDVENCFQIDDNLPLNTKYEAMTGCVEGLHNLVHRGVGGYMMQTYSPYDPIFYSHHANIDRIWYEWQQRSGDFLEAYSGDANLTIMGYNNVVYGDVFETTVYDSFAAARTSFPNNLNDATRTCDAPKFIVRDTSVPNDAVLNYNQGSNNQGSNNAFPLTEELERSLEFSASRVDLSIKGVENTCLPNFRTEANDENSIETTVIIAAGVCAGLLALAALVFAKMNHKRKSRKTMIRKEERKLRKAELILAQPSDASTFDSDASVFMDKDDVPPNRTKLDLKNHKSVKNPTFKSPV